MGRSWVLLLSLRRGGEDWIMGYNRGQDNEFEGVRV